MPETRKFDAVAMRAVDQMADAVREASHRATRQLLILTTRGQVDLLPLSSAFTQRSASPLPESTEGILLICDSL
jgi:hypothetical protein